MNFSHFISAFPFLLLNGYAASNFDMLKVPTINELKNLSQQSINGNFTQNLNKYNFSINKKEKGAYSGFIVTFQTSEPSSKETWYVKTLNNQDEKLKEMLVYKILPLMNLGPECEIFMYKNNVFIATKDVSLNSNEFVVDQVYPKNNLHPDFDEKKYPDMIESIIELFFVGILMEICDLKSDNCSVSIQKSPAPSKTGTCETTQTLKFKIIDFTPNKSISNEVSIKKLLGTGKGLAISMLDILKGSIFDSLNLNDKIGYNESTYNAWSNVKTSFDNIGKNNVDNIFKEIANILSKDTQEQQQITAEINLIWKSIKAKLDQINKNMNTYKHCIFKHQ